MLDAKNLLNTIDSNGLVGKMLGGMATRNFAAGLLTGGVASSLLGGKHALENTAKAGGLALLGTLAYKAYGNFKQQQASGGAASMVGAVKHSAQDMATQAKGLLSGLLTQTTAPSAAAPAAPETPATRAELALAIIRAMIGAAKADGQVDASESEKIMGQMDTAGITPQEKIILMQELANTPDIPAIAAAAATPEEAAQIYLAALLVCDSQCAKEQAYLSSLASALKLEAAFTASLQQELLRMATQQAA